MREWSQNRAAGHFHKAGIPKSPTRRYAGTQGGHVARRKGGPCANASKTY